MSSARNDNVNKHEENILNPFYFDKKGNAFIINANSLSLIKYPDLSRNSPIRQK